MTRVACDALAKLFVGYLTCWQHVAYEREFFVAFGQTRD